MIERYSRPEMAAIWSDQNKYDLWLKIEVLVVEKLAALGEVPESAAKTIAEKASYDLKRVHEIEAEVKHDVIAFLTSVAEFVGPDSRYIHKGMTSNDLLDTAFALQLKQSGTKILEGIDTLRESVKKRAYEFKELPCAGRSHGIHGEPISFGLKFASFYAELSRNRERLVEAIRQVSVGKLAGAMGTYGNLSPELERIVFVELGLAPETVATQVVARDRHAQFFLSLSLLGAAVERFCVEIRHLQRTEVGEVFEPFSKKQKGSSAMPHKKNPILTENMTGLARLLRSYGASSLENIALWHERDISHSSVERVIAPDACTLSDFLLHRMNYVVSGLVVNEERVRSNLELTGGMVFSGTLLLALTDSGMSREDAYALVQKHALEADASSSFPERIQADPVIREQLGEEKVKEAFALDHHLAHVDEIFERTFR